MRAFLTSLRKSTVPGDEARVCVADEGGDDSDRLRFAGSFSICLSNSESHSPPSAPENNQTWLKTIRCFVSCDLVIIELEQRRTYGLLFEVPAAFLLPPHLIQMMAAF